MKTIRITDNCQDLVNKLFHKLVIENTSEAYRYDLSQLSYAKKIEALILHLNAIELGIESEKGYLELDRLINSDRPLQIGYPI